MEWRALRRESEGEKALCLRKTTKTQETRNNPGFLCIAADEKNQSASIMALKVALGRMACVVRTSSGL